jgi:tight adherence protein B
VLPALLSLSLALGAYLFYDGLTRPRPLLSPRWRLARLAPWLAQTGVPWLTPRLFLMLSGGVALSLGAVAQWWLGWFVLTLSCAGLGALAPTIWVQTAQERREVAIEGAPVEAITQLRDAIRAGMGVEEAIADLAHGGPALLRQEFAAVTREARFNGLARALIGLEHRLATPLVKTVVRTLVLDDRMGSRQISRVLDRLAHAMGEQRRVRAELRAVQARQVLAARIVTLVPPTLLLLMHLLSPAYVAYFGTVAGETWLAGCVVLVGTGYWLMRRMARVPQ